MLILLLFSLIIVLSMTGMAYSFTTTTRTLTTQQRENNIINAPPPDVRSTSRLYMGMKVNIRIVGRKSSEPWLEEGVDMYEKRLRPSNVEIETTWHKDNVALMKGYEMDCSKNYKVICLDPKGKQPTSEVFTTNMYQWLDEGGSRLSFIIGGAEGLPNELKYPTASSKKISAPIMISLSSLTFTHQFARLLLIEQIYRATEIQKGSGYHK